MIDENLVNTGYSTLDDELLKNFNTTCSIRYPVNWGITFARTRYDLDTLSTCYNIMVFVQASSKMVGKITKVSNTNTLLYHCRNVDFDFFTTHNVVNLNKSPKRNMILTKPYNVHNSALIGVEGVNVAKNPCTGENVQIKHMGNVILMEGVIIGAGVIVERAVLDFTYLGKGSYVDVNSVIGHNSFIGENTIIAANSVVAGSCHVGKNCQIGIGSMIKNGVKICDDVIIGAGSVVTKDITFPGIYYGSPAVYKSEFIQGFKF